MLREPVWFACTKGTYFQNDGDFGSFQLSEVDGDIYIPKIDYNEPLKNELEHFIYCINENITPRTDAKSAINVSIVLQKINDLILKNEKSLSQYLV